jgi:hypothetical protein
MAWTLPIASKAVNRDRLDRWLTLLANLGVLGGLVFVGLEVRQNTSQLRADASYSITASVNELNAAIYSDPRLAELVFRGEADLSALTPIERTQFDAFEFSRLNISEYVGDLEAEGVSGLSFEYVEYIVRDFRTKPGLRAFIRENEELYVGSDELLARLLGS